MSSTGPFIKQPVLTPPINGSFPLDREGKCKLEMLNYMICLNENKAVSEKCRALSKEYMRCRMDNGLMQREDWEYLGFPDDESKGSPSEKKV